MKYLKRFLLVALLAFQLEAKEYPLDTLMRWDQCFYQLLEKGPLFDRGSDRLCAYLFHGQKEAFRRNENLDQISFKIIQLFYPSYGEGIASLTPLNFPLRERFKKEQAQIHSISLHTKGGGWVGKEVPYHGLEIPTWKPWVLTSRDQFRLPQPPSDDLFWKDQLAKVKQEMQKATEEQKERILFWASMPSAIDGNWVVIVNNYMQEHQVPLETQIKVRDAVGRAIVDASIAAFDTKYTYLIKRPYMQGPDLKTYIPTPNHPSFPSAHSTVSAAVVEVLNSYLPENTQEWDRLLEEAGMSRIWAGIHFPIDHEQGKILGKKVGQELLKH